MKPFIRLFMATLLLVPAGMFVAAGTGCGDSAANPRAPGDEGFFDNFKREIEHAQDEHYTPYWLGRGFAAGDVMFEGPVLSNYFEGFSGGGVAFRYSARVENHGIVVLDIALYSPEAWQELLAIRSPDPGGDISIAGHAGKLRVARDKNSPAGIIQLILPIDGTVVVVRATGSSPERGTPEPNPLMDEATFISVLDHLRPYPE